MNRYPLLERQVLEQSGSAKAPAKLNLWLEVFERRPDGFHEIESLMVPIALFDILSIRVACADDSGSLSGGRDQLRVIGPGAPETADNLVMQALALARDTRPIPALEIELIKKIPSRAGLGGGSSDAAAMLVLLDDLFEAPGGPRELRHHAQQLGSDVPFFLGSGAAVASGRGDILREAPQPLLGGDMAHFVLLIPEPGVDTRAAYASLSPHLTSGVSRSTFQECNFVEKSDWVGSLHNRLLDGVRRIEPALNQIADFLERVHPGRWSMTGSGSCFIVAASGQAEAEEESSRLRSHLAGWADGIGYLVTEKSKSVAAKVLVVPMWIPDVDSR
ncbi:MAG: 4-(cytidine 5'-diphospho)-2-C-methyl-D-erythritol kinase [Planctomycetota bacterium]|nr:4-(cytidine 5'-diphospho)-2-C-methyl-D-erythritol kinase [Planctomycetota bacterium]